MKVEITIRLSGDALSDKKVDKLLEMVRNINEVQEKEEKGNLEEGVNSDEEGVNSDEEGVNSDEEGVNLLKKALQNVFIELVQANRDKALRILNAYGVAKFSHLLEKLHLKEEVEEVHALIQASLKGGE